MKEKQPQPQTLPEGQAWDGGSDLPWVGAHQLCLTFSPVPPGRRGCGRGWGLVTAEGTVAAVGWGPRSRVSTVVSPVGATLPACHMPSPGSWTPGASCPSGREPPTPLSPLGTSSPAAGLRSAQAQRPSASRLWPSPLRISPRPGAGGCCSASGATASAAAQAPDGPEQRDLHPCSALASQHSAGSSSLNGGDKDRHVRPRSTDAPAARVRD